MARYTEKKEHSKADKCSLVEKAPNVLSQPFLFQIDGCSDNAMMRGHDKIVHYRVHMCARRVPVL